MQLLDYPMIVRKPMDLGTVRDKLLRGDYAEVQQCADDIQLCFKNALVYNEPKSDICKIAQRLLSDAERMFSAFIAEEKDVNESCESVEGVEVEVLAVNEPTLSQGEEHYYSRQHASSSPAKEEEDPYDFSRPVPDDSPAPAHSSASSAVESSPRQREEATTILPTATATESAEPGSDSETDRLQNGGEGAIPLHEESGTLDLGEGDEFEEDTGDYSYEYDEEEEEAVEGGAGVSKGERRVRFPDHIVSDTFYHRLKYAPDEVAELFYTHSEAMQFQYDYDREATKAEAEGREWTE
jgi:hypothetical protein